MITVDVVCYKYKPLKNGELPLKIKVCKDRKTRYINLGVSTKSENWDFENNRPKETCPDKEMLESLISKNISEVRSKIVELKTEKTDFTGELSTGICKALEGDNEYSWCLFRAIVGHRFR